MKSLSEQIRELEERAAQLERERDAQIALSREMLMDESRYAARREQFLQLNAAMDAAPIAPVQGTPVIDIPPAILRRMNWN